MERSLFERRLFLSAGERFMPPAGHELELRFQPMVECATVWFAFTLPDVVGAYGDFLVELFSEGDEHRRFFRLSAPRRYFDWVAKISWPDPTARGADQSFQAISRKSLLSFRLLLSRTMRAVARFFLVLFIVQELFLRTSRQFRLQTIASSARWPWYRRTKIIQILEARAKARP